MPRPYSRTIKKDSLEIWIPHIVKREKGWAVTTLEQLLYGHIWTLSAYCSFHLNLVVFTCFCLHIETNQSLLTSPTNLHLHERIITLFGFGLYKSCLCSLRAQSELLPESESLGFKSFKTPNKVLNCLTVSNLYWLTVTKQVGKDGLTERWHLSKDVKLAKEFMLLPRGKSAPGRVNSQGKEEPGGWKV